ncbi:hypothetical protein LTR15_008494 [Elasticomyces elasticus]|nr:hypothetical protein LTR15_008494 [Elasticomyces elasticus]
MEDARNSDRHDATPRRKTFSGPLRQDDENNEQDEEMRLPWSPPSAPTSPTSPVRPHRRTISGSILQRLNFLRPSSENARPPSRDKEPTSPKSAKSRKSIDDDSPIVSPTSPKGESAMSFALRPAKSRKRKGSLRKTALLGGKRILSESRERKSSVSAKSPLGSAPVQPQMLDARPHTSSGIEDDLRVPVVQPTLDGTSEASCMKKHFSYDDSLPSTTTSSVESLVEPSAVSAARLSLLTSQDNPEEDAISTTSSTTELGSPLEIRSPVSQTSYASTTSDDDLLNFDRPAQNITLSATSLLKPMSSSATSYFPTPSTTSLLKPNKHHPRSPLSHTVSSSSLYPPSPPPHDYTETAFWGWVILFSTWLTFTVGMGSCLGLWSWAWDVGETPYAPPELEDDPTLPIVGYYPALMVLTGVVAWVWVVVAWVGMKYFRHAGIEV